MIPNELLLLAVAGIAFYVGYKMGRMSVMAERGASRSGDDPEIVTADVTGADAAPLPGPGAPSRPRAAPPPASAGGGSGASNPSSAPRRSVAPPPARAGLLDPGGGKKK